MGKREGKYNAGYFSYETFETEAQICGQDGFDISEEQNESLRLDLYYCPDRKNNLALQG